MSVPGDRRDVDFAQLTTPGRLEFRKVLGITPPGEACPPATVEPRADQPLVACDAQKFKYALDVAKVTRSDLRSAEYTMDSYGEHNVVMTFTSGRQATGITVLLNTGELPAPLQVGAVEITR
jgi:hypothetical protein